MVFYKLQVRKGSFITGGAHPAVTTRPLLPTDLEQFEGAVAEADRLAAVPSLAEIERRIAEARCKLAELRAMVRRK